MSKTTTIALTCAGLLGVSLAIAQDKASDKKQPASTSEADMQACAISPDFTAQSP